MPRPGPHCMESISIVGAVWPGTAGGGRTDCLSGVGLGQNGSGRYGSTAVAYIHIHSQLLSM